MHTHKDNIRLIQWRELGALSSLWKGRFKHCRGWDLSTACTNVTFSPVPGSPQNLRGHFWTLGRSLNRLWKGTGSQSYRPKWERDHAHAFTSGSLVPTQAGRSQLKVTAICSMTSIHSLPCTLQLAAPAGRLALTVAEKWVTPKSPKGWPGPWIGAGGEQGGAWNFHLKE